MSQRINNNKVGIPWDYPDYLLVNIPYGKCPFTGPGLSHISTHHIRPCAASLNMTLAAV